jgi:molybdate transport system regulatory protein
MTPKIRTWVVFGDELKFGEGRARLLALIDEHGSLQKAAGALGMSYRNAWGYLGELERAAGFKFVERAAGGGPRSGMRLTARARRFLDRYARFRAGVASSARRHFAQAFRDLDDAPPRRRGPGRSSGG